jgi:uncharacterized protein (DUF1697 family)
MARPKRYVALLRGINVGGRNLIKMTALAAVFKELGFADVATYIQSGNVLFSATASDPDRLEKEIEEALSKKFEYESRLVAVSRDQLKAAIQGAPKGFGRDPVKFRYDVIFLKRPLTAAEAIKRIPVEEGVDTPGTANEVLYFSRLAEKAAQSRLPRVTQLPEYRYMTIRNWNTVTKLLSLMEAGG